MYSPGVSPPTRQEGMHYGHDRRSNIGLAPRRGSDEGGNTGWRPRPPSVALMSAWLHKPRPPSKGRPQRRKEDEYDDLVPYRDLEPEMDIGGERKGKKKGRTQLDRVKKQVLEKHALERAMVCFLAVSLLWLTSLPVAQLIVGIFIKSPDLDAVVAEINSAIAFTTEQQSDYVLCAERKAFDCNATFTEEVQTQQATVRRLEQENYELLLQHNATALSCRDHTSKAAALLNALTRSNSGFVLGNYENDNANSDDNCTLIESIIDGTAGENAILTLNVANDYTTKSDGTFRKVQEQAEKRAAYDAEYAQNRTSGYLNVSAGLDGIKELPGQIVEDFEAKVEEFEECLYNSGSTCPISAIDQIKSSQEDIAAKTTAFTTALEAFRTQLEEVAQGSNLDLPSLPFFPSNLGFLDTEAFKARLEDQVNEVLGTAIEEGKTTAEEVKTEAEESSAALNDLTSLDGYDPPPPVDPATVAEWDAIQESFITDMTEALRTTRSGEGDAESEFASGTAGSAAASNLLTSLDPREWDFYSYTPEVFEAILEGLKSVSNVLLNFDIAYRVVRSLQLIHKYWNISAVSTPPADLRVGPAKKGQVSPSFQRNPIQKIAFMLSNPLVNLSMFFVFFMVIVGGFYYIYSPLFNEYANSCVGTSWEVLGNDEGKVSNGTMLYRNVYTIAYQYASSEGDKVVATNVDQLNVGRDLICRDESQRSFQVAEQYEKNYRLLNNFMKEGYINRNAIAKCLKLSDIDSAFGSTYSSLGSDITSLQAHVNAFDEATCGVDLQPLQDSRYDCNEVGKCTVQCSGVSEANMREKSFDTACTAEWYVHGLILGSFLSFLLYCLMNLSRFMLLRGLVQVFWRHIATNRYQILATVTEQGDIMYPERVTEDGEAFKDVIEDELSIVLHKFTRQGVFILIGAMMVNIPWIVMLSFFSSNLSLN